jgi:hypothetical protein
VSGERARPHRRRLRKAPCRLDRTDPSFPTRPADRLEDVAAWVLMSLALLTVLAAVVVGRSAFDVALTRGHVAGATPVRAVLLADAVPTPAAGTGAPDSSPMPSRLVPVAWTGSDGVERTAELAVPAPMPAGTEVTMWLNGDRQPTTGAAARPQAMVFGIGVGRTVATFFWALLAVAWGAVQRISAACHAAAWAREWARVEPLWSRRVP